MSDRNVKIGPGTWNIAKIPKVKPNECSVACDEPECDRHKPKNSELKRLPQCENCDLQLAQSQADHWLMRYEQSEEKIKELQEELKIAEKQIDQLKGHFVKICKIKNILEEKS